jgi:hypothetical protein
VKQGSLLQLVPALQALGREPGRLFSQRELQTIDPEITSTCFAMDVGLWVSCAEVCGNAACGWAKIVGSWAQCSTHQSTIHIAKPEAYRRWRFRSDAFHRALQEILRTDLASPVPTEFLVDLGFKVTEKRTWRFFFAPSRLVLASPLRLAGLRATHTEDGLVVISEEQCTLPTYLKGLNIFHVGLAVFADTSMKELLESLTREHHHTLKAWEALREEVGEQYNPYFLSPLMNVASSALAQTFEDEVFAKLIPFFDSGIQLGKEYNGRSLPDGLLFGQGEGQERFVFYDCKSFKNADFSPKSEDAQQQVYYAHILGKFAVRLGIKSASCLVVTNQVPDEVAAKLMTLQPWRELADLTGLVILPVDAMAHMLRVKELLTPKAPDILDRSVLFEAMFVPKLLSENTDLDKDLAERFNRLRPRSPYHRIHVLDRLDVEVFLIISYMRGKRRKYVDEVDRIVKNAGTGQRSLSVGWGPAEQTLIHLVKQGKFEEAVVGIGLTAFGLELLSKSIENAVGSEVDPVFWKHLSKFRENLKERLG